MRSPWQMILRYVFRKTSKEIQKYKYVGNVMTFKLLKSFVFYFPVWTVLFLQRAIRDAFIYIQEAYFP